MTKKALSFVLVFALILVSGSAVHGNLQEKLTGHWSENYIDISFASYYFPYLAREGFANFNPNGDISKEDFTLSLASLFKAHGYQVSGISNPGVLTRDRMAAITGQRLLEIGLDPADDHNLTFGDVSTMDVQTLSSLKLLHREKIVNGETNSLFNPSRNTTQAEAIIILQRVESAIKGFNEIDFRTLGVTQTYTNQEEIVTKVSDSVVTLMVTKEFPTPGYSISVKNIVRENSSIRVYFRITPPDPGTILPQVITYKTITIELDREDLGDLPYDFVVDGFREI